MINEFTDVKCLRNLYTPPDSSQVIEDIELRKKEYEANRSRGIVDRQGCSFLGFKAIGEDDSS
jgi:hypothetical protein